MILDWLLAPISRKVFETQYWSKLPLVVSREKPNYYERTFSGHDIDHVLFLATRFPGALELLSEEKRPQSVSGRFDTSLILSSGKSFRITGVQRFSAALATIANDLEQYLNFPININLYISPSSKRRALRRHFDTHDVFALQLSGRKRWSLFEHSIQFPLEHLPLLQHEIVADMKRNRLHSRPNQVGESQITDEFVLAPGDLLYLPRGLPHEAATCSGETSCHLTVGVSPTTYLDLLTVALADAALSNVRLRKPLPIGHKLRFDAHREMQNEFRALVQSAVGNLDGDSAAGSLTGVFQRRNRALIENPLLSNAQIHEMILSLTLDTRMQIRGGISLTIDFGTNPARLVIAERKFEIGKKFIQACQYVAIKRVFCPGSLPGALTDEERLEFARLLMAAKAAVLASGLCRAYDVG